MTSPAPTSGRALVISYSKIESDPRVRRQIDWLSEQGWSIDTLGLGDGSSPQTRRHFVIAPPKPWMSSRIRLALAHMLLPNAALFHKLMISRVPAELIAKLQSGEYHFVLFNEYEFTPWAAKIRSGTKQNVLLRIHLDLHEYRQPRQRWRSTGGKITGSQYRWVRKAMGSPAFDSRTVVCEPIGRLYAEEFGFPLPDVVRNIPPYVEQPVSPVDPTDIRMLFHGMASFARGFSEILEAMRSLPEHFSMTFMLMPNERVHSWLRTEIENHPAKNRIRIVDPAPMRQIAEWINEYDLEIIFYRPTSQNLQFALPNKFFESIQGRLAVVVAEGETMAPIIREWGNGVVIDGFEADDLAAALKTLTPNDFTRMKQASATAAQTLNAAVEGENFIRAALGRAK